MDTNLERGSGEGNAGTRKRGSYRLHSLEEKRRVVHECLTSGESVSIIARRDDLNTNQVFHWRKLYERGQLGEALVPSAAPRLLAVRIEDAVAHEPKTAAPDAPTPQSWIEIECSRPYRVRVHGAVDAGALSRVLEVLAGR